VAHLTMPFRLPQKGHWRWVLHFFTTAAKRASRRTLSVFSFLNCLQVVIMQVRKARPHSVPSSFALMSCAPLEPRMTQVLLHMPGVRALMNWTGSLWGVALMQDMSYSVQGCLRLGGFNPWQQSQWVRVLQESPPKCIPHRLGSAIT